MNLGENETEIETEEIGETEPSDVTQERKLKRINLDAEDSLTETYFTLSKSDLKKLSVEATEKEISKGAIIRKLIKEHLAKEEKQTQPNLETIIPDKELEKLLNSCTAFQGGFQTTGDEGFFTQFRNREWKLSDLTDNQFIVLCNYLRVGYNGFYSQPSIEEFIGWVEDTEPSDEQLEIVELTLRHNVRYTEEDIKKPIHELIAEIKTHIETLNPEETEEES